MEFRLLGPIEVSDEGRRIPLGGHRQRMVLAVLLVDAGRVAGPIASSTRCGVTSHRRQRGKRCRLGFPFEASVLAVGFASERRRWT